MSSTNYIIPVPYAMGCLGSTAQNTYSQILQVSGASDSASKFFPSNLIQDNCKILNPVNFDTLPDNKPNKGRFLESAMSMQLNLAQTVFDVYDENSKICLIGGDHTISIGTGLGLARSLDMKKVGLIWVDAHGDFNTDLTSSSKSITGYPAAVVSGLGLSELTEPFDNNFIQKMVHIGSRDIEEMEKNNMLEKDVKILSAIDVQEYGLKNILTKSLDYLSDCETIWLSIDIDSLDSIYFEPGETDVPVTGGLTPRELMYIVSKLQQSNKLQIMEIVQLNNLNKQTNLTVLCSRLIEQFFGLGTFRYGV